MSSLWQKENALLLPSESLRPNDSCGYKSVLLENEPGERGRTKLNALAASKLKLLEHVLGEQLKRKRNVLGNWLPGRQPGEKQKRRKSALGDRLPGREPGEKQKRTRSTH